MVNPNIVIPAVIGGGFLIYGIYRILKGGKNKMARKPELGKEEEKEKLKEKLKELEESESSEGESEKEKPKEESNEPAANAPSETISEQEMIDMVNGHLARASQLLDFLKNLRVK